MRSKAALPFRFSRQTFAYFEEARRHETERAWFEAHRGAYEEHVSVPFLHLVAEMKEELAGELPGIDITAKKITKPLRRQMAGGGKEPVVRAKATAFFQEPATSMFESNPGIYLSLGAGAEDNVCGVGLYQPSGRQLKRLREGLVTGFDVIDGCLEAEPLKIRWGGLSGATYTRFPKGYDENSPAAPYLRHKQFFLSKSFTRKEVAAEGFIEQVVADLRMAVPFLSWMRPVVGVYRKPAGKDREGSW